MTKTKWRPMLGSVLLAILVGQLAHLIGGSIGLAYRGMIQAPLSPPTWLFAPVWVIMYVLMGYAAYLVWKSEDADRERAIKLYAAKLALHMLWPLIFFRLGTMWIAAIVLCTLIVLAHKTMRLFSAIDPKAGRLFLPYLIWILYLLYLNIGFAVMN